MMTNWRASYPKGYDVREARPFLLSGTHEEESG